MSEESYEVGKITIEKNYVIICNLCETEDNIVCDVIMEAEKYFRERGWVHRITGWYCPDCMENEE